jgi:hypothetical protein
MKEQEREMRAQVATLETDAQVIENERTAGKTENQFD